MELRTISDVQALNADKGKLGNQNLGQEDFMKLMLAQMKNQDPLKPMDNAQFLGQMAQFSTVSGISEINNSMASLADSLKSSQMLNAASLVDKQAVVASNVVPYDGVTPVAGELELPTSSTGVQVEIVSPNGEVARRLSLGPQAAGKVEFQWDGHASNGTALPAGQYRIRASYFDGSQQQGVTPFVHAHIDSVSLPSGGGSAVLELKGLGQFNLTDVKSIS